jgi:hypothetical protein
MLRTWNRECPAVSSARGRTEGLSGIWKFPVTRSRTTERMRKPCSCMGDARKLHLCLTCRTTQMALFYQRRFRKGSVKLGGERSQFYTGEVLPEDYENPGPRQKYQCYVCRGFLMGMTFDLTVRSRADGHAGLRNILSRSSMFSLSSVPVSNSRPRSDDAW